MLQHAWTTDIRWIWGQLKGLRLRISGIGLIGLLRIAASLTFVWVCKLVVDVATGVRAGNIWMWLSIMAGVIVVQSVIIVINIRVREYNLLNVSNVLRSRLFAHALRSRWEGRDAFHTGDAVNRLKEDIHIVSLTATETIPTMFLSCVQLIAASFVLFSMQRNLLWVLLMIMPIAVVVSKIYFKILRRLTEQLRQQDSQIQSHIQESLLKRILLLSLGREEDNIRALEDKQNHLLDTAMTRVRYSNQSRIIIRLGFMTGYIITFGWSALGIMEGVVTYGMMTACLQLVNQVQNPLVDLSSSLPRLIQALTSVDRLREIDELTEETHGAKEMLAGPLGIRIQGLHFRYPQGESEVLSHLDYDFKPGSTTAIVGETGSGKSTLIRLILALLQADSGSICLYGAHGERPTTAALRCNFCYVPQGNSLMSGTIRQNLLLGNPAATEADMRQALHLAAADFVWQRPHGIDTPCSEEGGGLSEGQAQRIAIARALLQPGAIILMDEACSAIDSQTEKRILENLRDGTDGKTILWVTHHAAVKDFMKDCLLIGD